MKRGIIVAQGTIPTTRRRGGGIVSGTGHCQGKVRRGKLKKARKATRENKVVVIAAEAKVHKLKVEKGRNGRRSGGFCGRKCLRLATVCCLQDPEDLAVPFERTEGDVVPMDLVKSKVAKEAVADAVANHLAQMEMEDNMPKVLLCNKIAKAQKKNA
jgi:hypothetical protein